jgi:hypothetical protein
MQHPGEDVQVFASQLQEQQTCLLSTLYTAEELKGKFSQGFAPGVGELFAPVGPSHKDERFMALVTRTADLAQGVTFIAQHSTGKLSTFYRGPTSSPTTQICVGRSRLLAIIEPGEKSCHSLESPKTMISMMWRWMLSLAVWSFMVIVVSPLPAIDIFAGSPRTSCLIVR